MEVVATAKWVRVTARKARLISHMVEGLPVGEALTVLRFTPRSAARDIAKVIKSAAANAEHNYNLDASTLRVSRVEVDGAMIIKRWRAKPRGMVGSVFKRTSHLRAFVTDDEQAAHTKRRSVVRMPRALTPTAVLSTPSTLAVPRRRRATAPPPAETPPDEAPAGEESPPKRSRRRRAPTEEPGE
jgi:large subunit ribosomal protein L22